MLDRIEDAQARVRGIARQQNHLDILLVGTIEPKHLFDQRERRARREELVLVLDLIALIGVDALLGEDEMALGEVEQGPRRDRNDQLVGERRLGHPAILAPARRSGYGGAQKTAPSSIHPAARVRCASAASTT